LALVKTLSRFNIKDVHNSTLWVEQYGFTLTWVVTTIDARDKFKLSAIDFRNSV